MPTAEDIAIEVLKYFYLVIFIAGVVGNTISFMVYSRKKFEKTLFSVYFRTVLVTDLFQLVNCVYHFIRRKLHFNLEFYSLFVCKTRDYFVWSTAPMSGYILVLVSLDRLLSIRFPTRFQIRNNKLFQLSLIISYAAFCAIAYIPLITSVSYLLSNNSNGTNLDYECIHDTTSAVNIFDMFNLVLIPFTLMLIFTSLTIRIIIKSKMKIKSKNMVKDIRFAFVSIGFNLTFFILNFPSALFFVMPDNSYGDIFFYIGNIMYYCNFALKFYFDLLFNSLFRHELILLCQPVKKKKTADIHQISVETNGIELSQSPSSSKPWSLCFC